MRRLASHETAFHRDLRLRALADAPNSFGETFADAAARPDSYWEELTGSVTHPGGAVMFVAEEGDVAIGSAYGLVDRDDSETGHVGGMWVEPSYRKRGVGRALLDAIFEWARGREMLRLGLWAPLHSPGAIALYSKAGFRETGSRRPLPSNPSLTITEMEVAL